MKTYLRRTIAFADKALLEEDACYVECKFDQLVAEGAYLNGSVFVDCHFENVDLYWCNAFLCRFVDCVFVHCDFRGDFGGSVFARCRFNKCDYGKNNLGGDTRWEDATAVGCTVTGPPLPIYRGQE